MSNESIVEILNSEHVQRMSRDITKAAVELSDSEVRYLVDAYYMMQEDRKRSSNQVRALSETEEPNQVISYLATQSATLESQIKRALDHYTKHHPVGAWLRDIKGIGPVISAGLLAHIDIEKAPTAGHIWRYAGLDPTSKWEKGQKRPWNASLKRLCWIIGECFVKVSGYDDAYYGHIWAKRKRYEEAKNEAGEYAEQARAIAAARPTHAQRATYEAGKLPQGHIHARAKRYAVKLFLSHLHAQMYRAHFGKEPPAPYPIAILGHAHLK